MRVSSLTPQQAAVLYLDQIGVKSSRREVWLQLSRAAERTQYLRGIRKVALIARGEQAQPSNQSLRHKHRPRLQRTSDLFLIPLEGG